MFKKILIAEDIDTLNLGEGIILKHFPDTEILYTRYCDDALLKIKRAVKDGEPFDLLITDLSFVPDHREVILVGGEDLIKAVTLIQPELKIIVYSIEDRFYKIRSLLELPINGYVWKGREGSADIIKALEAIPNGEKFISSRFSSMTSTSSVFEISDYDRKLLELLSTGIPQTEIADILSKNGMFGSKSNVEKHISLLKISLKAKNTIHLISIAKDLGIIS